MPRWLLLSLLLSALGGAAVEAQGTTPDSAVAASEHDALLAEAVTAYERSDLAHARALFERVHGLAPTARTLRSLAMVAYRQERFADAAALFEQSLASDVKPLTGRMREDAVRLLEEASVRARVRMEAEPAEPPPNAAPAPSAAPADASIHHVAQPAPRPAHPSPTRRARRLKRSGYALLALSAASLVLSGAALLTGLSRLDEIASICRDQAERRCFRDDARRLEDAAQLDLLSALSIGGLVLGAASGVSAVTLLTLHHRGPTAGNERAATVVGITTRWRF